MEPKMHFLTTAPFVAAELLSESSIFFKLLKIFLILFSGVGIDIDHFSKERWSALIKDIKGKGGIKGIKVYNGPATHNLFSGWINYFHTWKGLVLFLAISGLLESPFLLIAFVLHIFIDAGNCWMQVVECSPLPQFLHHKILLPLSLVYTNPKFLREKSFEEWREEAQQRKRRSGK